MLSLNTSTYRYVEMISLHDMHGISTARGPPLPRACVRNVHAIMHCHAWSPCVETRYFQVTWYALGALLAHHAWRVLCVLGMLGVLGSLRGCSALCVQLGMAVVCVRNWLGGQRQQWHMHATQESCWSAQTFP